MIKSIQLYPSFFFPSPVGNKNDQPENKVVETEDAKRFALQMGVETFETSAKDNINIEDVCIFQIFVTF